MPEYPILTTRDAISRSVILNNTNQENCQMKVVKQRKEKERFAKEFLLFDNINNPNNIA